MRPSWLKETAALRAAALTTVCVVSLASVAQAAVTFHPPVRAAVPLAQRSIMRPDTIKFTYTTLDDAADPTFNQLLGINDKGEISGYFGSGAVGHPNQGYTILPPYAQSNYTNENFPGSVQTQVTALNNLHDTAGFWVDGKGINRGFVQWNGVFASYVDPKTGKGTVNQLLGINNAGTAVGFYTDANNINHAYSVNQATSVFTPIKPPGLTNTQATGINVLGDICGIGVAGNGATVGWLLKNGSFSEFNFPNAMATQPFGINTEDVIVGVFVDAANATHGFRLANPLTHAQWQQLDDPKGVGNTFANGINDQGDIVGFYVDAAGNTDGFIALP